MATEAVDNVKQYTHLCMASPDLSSGMTSLNSLGFYANIEGQSCMLLDVLHVSPRTAPSDRAKLCTYSACFLQPSRCYLTVGIHSSVMDWIR